MKTCKKCGRTLPEGFKHKVCANCMGKNTDKLKAVGKNAFKGLGVAVGGFAIIKLVPKGVKTLSKFIFK